MATRSIATSHDWTIARLHTLPDDGNRYEIIDGAPYVTPSPPSVHQRAVVTCSSYRSHTRKRSAIR